MCMYNIHAQILDVVHVHVQLSQISSTNNCVHVESQKLSTLACMYALIALIMVYPVLVHPLLHSISQLYVLPLV